MSNQLFFVPVRRGLNEAVIIVEAKNLREAINYIKQLPEYYKNFNKLNWDKQQELGPVLVLEEEFCKMWGFKQKRFPEKIPPCKHRKESKKFLEWLCNGIDEREVEDNRCIIHRPHFKFDLPKDCPYLKKDSPYIEFLD